MDLSAVDHGPLPSNYSEWLSRHPRSPTSDDDVIMVHSIPSANPPAAASSIAVGSNSNRVPLPLRPPPSLLDAQISSVRNIASNWLAGFPPSYDPYPPAAAASSSSSSSRLGDEQAKQAIVTKAALENAAVVASSSSSSSSATEFTRRTTIASVDPGRISFCPEQFDTIVRALTCKVCTEIVRDPLACSNSECGELVCRACVEQMRVSVGSGIINPTPTIDVTIPCTICKKTYYQTDRMNCYAHTVFGEVPPWCKGQLASLIITCENAAMGCPWKRAMGRNQENETKHAAVCEYIPAKCRLCGKDDMILKDLAKHKTDECPERTIVCDICSEDIKITEMINHKTVPDSYHVHGIKCKGFIYCSIGCHSYDSIVDKAQRHEARDALAAGQSGLVFVSRMRYEEHLCPLDMLQCDMCPGVPAFKRRTKPIHDAKYAENHKLISDLKAQVELLKSQKRKNRSSSDNDEEDQPVQQRPKNLPAPAAPPLRATVASKFGLSLYAPIEHLIELDVTREQLLFPRYSSGIKTYGKWSAKIYSSGDSILADIKRDAREITRPSSFDPVSIAAIPYVVVAYVNNVAPVGHEYVGDFLEGSASVNLELSSHTNINVLSTLQKNTVVLFKKSIFAADPKVSMHQHRITNDDGMIRIKFQIYVK